MADQRGQPQLGSVRQREAIIESVDEFYSENLAQEVTRGMREAASRGFFLGSKAPFGYKRVKVNDGAKERPTLEMDPATAPIVKEIFESSLRGNGLKEICRELNDRGITNRGKRWYKGGLHYLLTNEAYTGTAVWGRTSKGEKAQDPVRVEGAWPALVSRELFDAVQQAMQERAPAVQRPARVGSKFLLSGLLKCGVCGRPYIGQGAKSGQYGYYICGTLFREGAGTCSARYLNAPRGACLRSSTEGFDLVRSKRYRVSTASLIVVHRSTFRYRYSCRRTILPQTGARRLLRQAQGGRFHHREDQGANPHRGDHRGAGDAGCRGDRCYGR